MPIHPAYVERFPLLEGIESFEQLMSDPALEERFHAFMQWRDAAPPPDVSTQDTTVPGPHGPVPVRIYAPDGEAADRPCLVWHHGGAFMMGDLDMPEADRTSREVCARAGAVVVSVDYRLAVGGVHYPIPLDDCVAVLRWVRDGAIDLGVDPTRIDAEYDDLRASEEAFLPLLTAAGVDVRRHLAPGTMHGFANLPAEVEPVGEVFELIATEVARPVGVLHG